LTRMKPKREYGSVSDIEHYGAEVIPREVYRHWFEPPPIEEKPRKKPIDVASLDTSIHVVKIGSLVLQCERCGFKWTLNSLDGTLDLHDIRCPVSHS